MQRQISILIDGAQSFNKEGTGIASYTRSLASTLGSLGCKIEVLYGRPMVVKKNSTALELSSQVFGELPKQGRVDKLLNAVSLAVHAYAPFRGSVRPIEISQAGVDLATREPPLPKADVIWNASRLYDRAGYFFQIKRRFIEVRLDSPVALAHWTGPMAVKAKGCPNVYTLHDLVPLQFPHFVVDRAGRSALLHAVIAREADLVITVSEASKQAIIELLGLPPERVCVTYQPTPPLPNVSREDSARLVQSVYGVKAGKYALFLGAVEPKKNLKRLIEAFLLANPGIPLLIAGPLGWLYTDILELMATVERNSEQQDTPVRRLGYLPRRHVTALLQCARFFAFPSIWEGFGLPVLEAMQMGVPVLTSNTGSLPEVAGDAAVLVDPLDIEAMSRGIQVLAGDEDLRRDLIARGYLQAQKFGRDIYIERLREAYARVGVELPKQVVCRQDAPRAQDSLQFPA